MARTLTQPGPERANRLIFLGAVALAALAAILVFVALANFGGSDKSSKAVGGGPVGVVVAARDVSAGTKLTDDMLEVKQIPSDAAVAGHLSDKATAVGLTTRVALAKGEQITTVKVGQASKERTFSDVVPQGKRAVAVSVQEKTNVGGLVVAGDHVDVIVIGKKDHVDPAKPDQEFPTAFTLLQDVEVLSVAQTAQKPTVTLDKDGNPIQTDTAAGNTATRPDDTDPSKSARTVTLAVTPEEAVQLALASDSYTVYLSLRPNGDTGKLANPGDLIVLPALR